MFDLLEELPVGSGNGLRGYGHCEEEYRKLETGWRMSFMRLTRLRIDRFGERIRPGGPGLLRVSTDWLPEP
jgi:hypothetical protein